MPGKESITASEAIDAADGGVSLGRPIALIAIVAFIAVFNSIFGWSDYLGSADGLTFLREMVDENIVAASFAYIAITVVGCVLLFLPGIVFAVIAGTLFGPVVGTVLCTIAATIGAAASFLAGRFFLKDSLKPKIAKNRYLKRLLFEDEDDNPILVLAITRLVPIFPYNLQNFAYGITDMRFWTYTWYSFLFMIPGTALYTVAAAGLTSQGDAAACAIAVAVLAVAICGIGIFMKRRGKIGGNR